MPLAEGSGELDVGAGRGRGFQLLEADEASRDDRYSFELLSVDAYVSSCLRCVRREGGRESERAPGR